MKRLSNPYLATLLFTMTAQAALADRLLDPTRPASARASTPTKFEFVRLEAVFRADGGFVAIVNGKVVRAGDRIGSVRIDEVFPSGIRYTRDGRALSAHLNGSALKVRQNVVPNEDET